MMIELREITDIESLLEMRMEVLDCVFEHPSYQMMNKLKEANSQYYQVHIADGTHRACFAYADDKLCGSGAICLQQEMPSPDNISGRCAYIMNVYVRPEYRQHGVATKIVEWLIECARSVGAEKIYLETTDMAHDMYNSIGFHEMTNMMKYGK